MCYDTRYMGIFWKTYGKVWNKPPGKRRRMKKKKVSGGQSRIYVCHTYYHVYVTFLKELKLRAEGKISSKADLVLSKMSNDFEDLKSRVERTGLFRQVYEFDEKREDFLEMGIIWMNLECECINIR